MACVPTKIIGCKCREPDGSARGCVSPRVDPIKSSKKRQNRNGRTQAPRRARQRSGRGRSPVSSEEPRHRARQNGEFTAGVRRRREAAEVESRPQPPPSRHARRVTPDKDRRRPGGAQAKDAEDRNEARICDRGERGLASTR